MEPKPGTAHPKPILLGPSLLEAQKPETLPSLIKTPKSFGSCKYIITRLTARLKQIFDYPNPPKAGKLEACTSLLKTITYINCKDARFWFAGILKTHKLCRKKIHYQCSLSHLMPSAFSQRINFQLSDFDTLYNNYLTANSTTLRQSVI